VWRGYIFMYACLYKYIHIYTYIYIYIYIYIYHKPALHFATIVACCWPGATGGAVIYLCMPVYIYIFKYREREREIIIRPAFHHSYSLLLAGGDGGRGYICICLSVYIYIYTPIYKHHNLALHFTTVIACSWPWATGGEGRWC